MTLAALALAALPGTAMAQAAKPKPAATVAKPKATTPAARPKPAPPSEEELKAATGTLSLFVSAFNSKDVPAETKAGLMLCLYGNPLGKIARGQTQALAENSEIKTPTQRLLLLATLCNAPLPKPEAAKPADAPAADATPEPSPSN